MGYEVYPTGILLIKLALAILVSIFYLVYLRKRYKEKAIHLYSSIILVIVMASSCCTTVPDTDGDGYKADIDAFPLDPTEWNDTDGDRYGDNRDKFPKDPTEWNDTDGDGYGDNKDAYPNNPYEWKKTYAVDFYPGGNGAIKLMVTNIRADNSNDEWSSRMDPYFISKVDYWNNGEWDYIIETDVMRDTELASNLTIWNLDINDGVTIIRFKIEVRDAGMWGMSTGVDMNPHPDYYSMIHIIEAPFKHEWSYDGSDDGLENERDCAIDYQVETINNETGKNIDVGWGKNITNIDTDRVYHIEPLLLDIPVKYYGYGLAIIFMVAVGHRLYFGKWMRKANWRPKRRASEVKILSPRVEDEVEYVENGDYEVVE